MNYTQGEWKSPMQARQGFVLFYCKLDNVSKDALCLVMKNVNAD